MIGKFIMGLLLHKHFFNKKIQQITLNMKIQNFFSEN